ncbi:MAG: hypothetical protein SGILL_004219 [Bacillariaceae sp.]
MIMGCAANYFCETVKFPQEAGNDDLTLFVSPWNYRTKGAWTVDNTTFIYTTCRSYGALENDFGFGYSVDALTRTVWSFSIMTPIIGGLLIFAACLGPCTTVNPSRWKCIGIVFVLLTIFQGLTLLVEASSICRDNPVLQYLASAAPELAETFPDTCEWATGFGLNIASVICWFLAGAFAILGPSPVVDPNEEPQEQTVTYTQNADGTIQETNVAVVKGKPVPPQEEADA